MKKINKNEQIVMIMLVVTLPLLAFKLFFNPSENNLDSSTTTSEQSTEIITTDTPTEIVTEESTTRHLNNYNKEFWRKLDIDNQYNEQRRQASDLVKQWYSINHSAPDLSWFQLTMASGDLAKFLYEDASRLYKEGVQRTSVQVLSNVIYDQKPLTIKVIVIGRVNSEDNRIEELTFHVGFNDDLTEIVTFEQVETDERNH